MIDYRHGDASEVLRCSHGPCVPAPGLELGCGETALCCGATQVGTSVLANVVAAAVTAASTTAPTGAARVRRLRRSRMPPHPTPARRACRVSHASARTAANAHNWIV